jgi:hypothetical protein
MVTEGFASIDFIAQQFSEAIYLVVTSTAQLIHPFWVFESIIVRDQSEGTFLFSTPLFLLHKFGLLTNISEAWTFPGLFLSLPGAAYHDFGLLGMITVSLLHGFALAICIRLLMQRHLSGLSLTWIIIIFSMTILSPLLPVFVAGPFPFMVAAFVAIIALKRTVYY